MFETLVIKFELSINSSFNLGVNYWSSSYWFWFYAFLSPSRKLSKSFSISLLSSSYSVFLSSVTFKSPTVFEDGSCINYLSFMLVNPISSTLYEPLLCYESLLNARFLESKLLIFWFFIIPEFRFKPCDIYDPIIDIVISLLRWISFPKEPEFSTKFWSVNVFSCEYSLDYFFLNMTYRLAFDCIKSLKKC